VQIGEFTEPGGVFLFPLSYLLADVIAEVYGYQLAKRQVFYITFSLMIFTLIVTLVIHLPYPLSNANYQSAYKIVLGNNWRACIGFILAMFLSDWLNVYLVSKWKILLKGRYFWMRSVGANAISEFAFSSICSVITYYGVVDVGMYFKLLIDVWVFKMVYIAIIGYAMLYLVALLKKHENIPEINTIKESPFVIS